MSTYSRDFANVGKHAWFNAASEGPLPLVSAKSLKEAIGWKSKVHELTLERFQHVPRDLKESIAKLLNVSYRDVILANSVTYGISLLANGIPWKKDDEILLMQNDFPSDILPWLALEEKGVNVRQLKPANVVLSAAEVETNISSHTKLVCLPQVHSFSGWALPVQEIAMVCKKHQVLFVLNIAQSAGNMPIDLQQLKVDAVVAAGYKWLCGPYGTGFCWMTPQLREQLHLNMNYWISTMTDAELQDEGALRYKRVTSARALDVFGTANFFNFVPFKTSIDYFLNIGLDNVKKYNQQLIDHFLEGIKTEQYDVTSSIKKEERSNLVVFSHKNKAKNKSIYERLNKEKIYLALWKNNLRFSPHVYNTVQQVKRLLTVLGKS